MVCTGPACSNDESRDGCHKPPIDARALVARWKEHRLYRAIHLTLTGCLGQCGRANQALLLSDEDVMYLERIEHEADADRLVQWGLDCLEAESMLPLPVELKEKRYQRLMSCQVK